MAIAPISDAHNAFAQEVADKLLEKDIRVILMRDNESLGKKIRTAKTERIPYTLVIGDAEVAGRKVTLEARDAGKVGELSLPDLIMKISQEISEKK